MADYNAAASIEGYTQDGRGIKRFEGRANELLCLSAARSHAFCASIGSNDSLENRLKEATAQDSRQLLEEFLKAFLFSRPVAEWSK